MLETSARLLRLLSLFQGRRYWSGGDLAERLEVTPRTLRRDVDKLRSLGYPIHSAPGAEGGYQLGAGTEMPPLLLDDDEAVAVAYGLSAGASGAVSGIEEASVRALAKMEQILPPRLARRVAALQAMVVSMPSGMPQTPVHGRTLVTLASACRDSERLQFKYEDHGGKSSARNVEPHRLVHLGSRWYLVAWDSGRSDWRTFRVDRIDAKISVGQRCPPRQPPAKDLARYVAQGAFVAPPCRARVKLHVPAEAAMGRLPYCIGLIEPVDERSCYYDMHGANYESLAMHVILLRVDFTIDGPEELVVEVRRVIDRYMRSISHHVQT